MQKGVFSGMREVGGQRKNASRVRLIAAAAVALVIYGVLFYIVFYDKLRGAGAFSSMVADYRNLNTFLAKHGGKSLPYSVYFLGGLALAAILYMTVVTALRIRLRISFFLYVIFFGIGLLYVVQPSKLLLTVLFSVALLWALHLSDARIRYPVALVIVGLYGAFVSHAALAIIPIYLLARLWQKNDTVAIRICIVALLVFCLLYQSGLVAKVYELHPGVTEEATYRRLFPDENYMGHVSYYLLDTCLTLLRILFPVEVFRRVQPLLWIFSAAQIVTTIFMFRWFRRLLAVDWSAPVHRNDRLQADVLAVLFALYVSLCFAAKEPSEVLRMASAWYPFLLFGAFAADRTVRYPVQDRDLSDACPVVFFHTGESDTLGDVLQQAGKSCGFKNVVLLGDESNRGLVSNWVDAETLTSDDLTEFREIYKTVGETGDEEMVRRCFERHFLLYTFLTNKGCDRCFLCDSDVLLFDDLSKLPMDDVDFACTTAEASDFLKERVSPHCTYWTTLRLRKFLDFVLRVYRSNMQWLTDVCLKQEEDGGRAFISDSVLVAAWCKLTARYDKNFRFKNLCEVADDTTWDFSLATADNSTPDEYVYLTSQRRKAITFRKDRKPYFTKREDGEKIRAVCIHCSGCRSYIPLLRHEHTCGVLYLLARWLY